MKRIFSQLNVNSVWLFQIMFHLCAIQAESSLSLLEGMYSRRSKRKVIGTFETATGFWVEETVRHCVSQCPSCWLFSSSALQSSEGRWRFSERKVKMKIGEFNETRTNWLWMLQWQHREIFAKCWVSIQNRTRDTAEVVLEKHSHNPCFKVNHS